MISIRELRVDYDTVCAVRDLTLEIGPGQVFGLIGPNGAGKTSTMRAVAGLVEPTYGTIELCGQDVRDARSVFHRVGFMPDFPPLYDDLLVWEFLDLFAASYRVPRRERPARVGEALELVGLVEKRQAMILSLSRGMRQRLMLAKTLLPRPDVLLLDEPASGVDPHGRMALRNILLDLASQGRAVLISSHILAEMNEFCSVVGVMERGRLVVSGRVDELAARLTSESAVAIDVVDGAERLADVLASRGLEAEAGGRPGEYRVPFRGTPHDVSELLAALVAAGVKIASFTRMKPSLEELFLSAGAKELS
ncbi:MAG: ABC transporter ATP-binding protein [Planctomycetota bacterium]